jgi:hypothetical protein
MSDDDIFYCKLLLVKLIIIILTLAALYVVSRFVE